MKFVSLVQSSVIEEATSILKHGGSIVYPTDTVYGLGVNPFDDFAVKRLFRIKKRPANKPVPLIVKSIAMAKKLAYIDARPTSRSGLRGASKEKILRSLWPGPVSAVLYKRYVVSSLISAGTSTVSLRMPDNQLCLDLIKAFNGPITSTSANISGEPAMNNPQAIYDRFQKEVYKPDLIIDGGVLKTSQPSTVLDLTGDRPRVSRVGPVKLEDLKKILNFEIPST